MAVLGATTLTGCSYIESFIAGGSRCVFNQTIPSDNGVGISVGWTKETSLTYNNIALRVVTGTVTPGGSTAFTTVLTQKSIGLSVQPASAGVTFNQASGNVGSGQQVASGSFSAGPALADLPAHDHSYSREAANPVFSAPAQRVLVDLSPRTSGSAGGDNGHQHGITFTQHSHGVASTHGHVITGAHTHTPPAASLQEDFAVLYRDVVIATKDSPP
jgi:hypothetical protein